MEDDKYNSCRGSLVMMLSTNDGESSRVWQADI